MNELRLFPINGEAVENQVGNVAIDIPVNALQRGNTLISGELSHNTQFEYIINYLNLNPNSKIIMFSNYFREFSRFVETNNINIDMVVYSQTNRDLPIFENNLFLIPQGCSVSEWIKIISSELAYGSKSARTKVLLEKAITDIYAYAGIADYYDEEGNVYVSNKDNSSNLNLSILISRLREYSNEKKLEFMTDLSSILNVKSALYALITRLSALNEHLSIQSVCSNNTISSPIQDILLGESRIIVIDSLTDVPTFQRICDNIIIKYVYKWLSINGHSHGYGGQDDNDKSIMLFLDNAGLYCDSSSDEDDDIWNQIISEGKYYGVYYTMLSKYINVIPKYILSSFKHYIFGSLEQDFLFDIKDTLKSLKLNNYNDLESFFPNATRNDGIYINQNNSIDNTGCEVYKFLTN